MNFNSDNWAGAHPTISQNLLVHSEGMAAAYGQSELDKQVEALFSQIFEHEVAVFFVGTGTAANSLGMAAVNRPGGVCFCHNEAHMVKDECGAPEYFTGGARLQTISGAAGKISSRGLERELNHFRPDFVHAGQPMAVTITQATETGSVYQLPEIAELSSICRKNDLPLHMDGARFANALASLEVSPAEMTWRQGVDILSFGGTKNGCWCAEALLFFNPSQSEQLPYIRKRAAQLFSKTRFIAAQFEAYFKNDLWLKLARHANEMAAELGDIISQSEVLRLAWPVEANEVFVIAPHTEIARWQKAGAGLYDWPIPEELQESIAHNEQLVRLVTNYQTSREELSQFRALVTQS
ncbi:MAG: threonine aldolase family protein [Roseibacillus sp.]